MNKTINIVNPTYPSSIFGAIDMGDIKWIRTIVKENPDLTNQRNKYNMTPLHYAAGRPNEEIVEFLLKVNPSATSARDCLGSTPLHYAVFNGFLTSAKLLLKACPETAIAVQGKGGNTALHYATKQANGELSKVLTELLLQYLHTEKDINRKNEEGDTPLETAKKYGGLEWPAANLISEKLKKIKLREAIARHINSLKEPDIL